MKRRVFYSFHYQADSWRAAQVRNIGVIEGNSPATDNDWETVARGGQDAILSWIRIQMRNRTCAVVLVGEHTATRQWVIHEIIEAWNQRMGVVGIYIHGLRDQHGHTSIPGRNPFDCVTIGKKYPLSSIARCYNPAGNDSVQCYNWIKAYLSNAVEEAINIRSEYG